MAGAEAIPTQATSRISFHSIKIGPKPVTCSHRQADLVDTSTATDIHGTNFVDPVNPIAVNGILDPTITPATYVPFVNYLNATQLARFGLHNGTHFFQHYFSFILQALYMIRKGDPNDPTLIDGKWESLALGPCDDPDFPNDYFLFTAVS